MKAVVIEEIIKSKPESKPQPKPDPKKKEAAAMKDNWFQPPPTQP
jgi:hypothetical protein